MKRNNCTAETSQLNLYIRMLYSYNKKIDINGMCSPHLGHKKSLLLTLSDCSTVGDQRCDANNCRGMLSKKRCRCESGKRYIPIDTIYLYLKACRCRLQTYSRLTLSRYLLLAVCSE